MAVGTAQCFRGLLLLLAVALASALQDDDSSRVVAVTNSSTRRTTAMTTSTTTTTTAKPNPLKEKLDELSERFMRVATKEFYPLVSEIISDPELSIECIGALMKLGPALRDFEIWAVEMMDAMGKPAAGLLQGRVAMYGMYDQCLGIRHEEGLFQGKYCMVHYYHDGSPIPPEVISLAEKYLKHIKLDFVGNITHIVDNPATTLAPLLKYGACIPSVCRREDVQIIVDHLTSDLGLKLTAKWCSIEEPVVLDQRQTLIVCIFGLWVSFLLFGTAFDIYKTMLSPSESKELKTNTVTGFVSEALASVSLRRAILKLIDMPDWGDYSNRLGFIHGVRVLSATWVVLGHSHFLRDVHASSNIMRFIRRVQDDFLFTVQINSFMAVETFICMTGFLSGYLVMRAPKTNTHPVLVYMMALGRRYFRLIVPIAAVLGFVYLIPAMVDGPLIHDFWPLFRDPCDKNWWKLFTMTLNYMDDYKDLCLPFYWYISVDYQLVVFGSIVLLFITPKWPKFSLWIMGATVAATCLTTTIQIYVNNYTPFNAFLTTDLQRIIDSSMYVYARAYTHAPPMFLGMLFGCLAAKRHHMSRLFQGAAWALATAVSLAALLGVRSWFDGRKPPTWEIAIYGGLHRASWALGVSWVMYACCTGRGGYVTKILAWPLLYPLGRLSFAVYQVHILLMGINAVVSREFISQHPFLQAQNYLSQTMMSYFLGAIMYLCLECPVAGLDNTFFSVVMPKSSYMVDLKKGADPAHELKAVDFSNGAVAVTTLDELPPKQQRINGFPDVTKNGCNGRNHDGYVNSACETDLNDKETTANGTIISMKF